jgi:hypothetical protein
MLSSPLKPLRKKEAEEERREKEERKGGGSGGEEGKSFEEGPNHRNL